MALTRFLSEQLLAFSRTIENQPNGQFGISCMVWSVTMEISSFGDVQTCRRWSCTPHLVSAIAAAIPAATALRDRSARLSYGDLNARANQLARYLMSLGIGLEVPVGICLDRSFDRIVATLAVLKAGGAFLPLDPAWPDARLRLLLADAGAPVLIGTEAIADRLGRAGGGVDGPIVVALDRAAGEIARLDSGAVEVPVRREHLAYVIYTSGSTGTPKGVEITHGNLLNLVFWHRRAFAVTSADKASHLAGLGFDAAVWEIWPYLTAGASVALVDEPVRTSPELLRQWLCDEQITMAFVPTALAEPMIAADWPIHTALRCLLTGGDTLHTRPRRGLPFAVVNNYGPTECTVVATSGVIPAGGDDGALPPIGPPIAHTQIHILDADSQPVAAGELGEIHIGGASVGRGYRNRPDLTAQAFVPDRFGAAPGARLYRTGDLGRRLLDGQIAFHGRLDNQAQIRGQRVEPDEIASVLIQHPRVASAAVIARGGGTGEKRLIAYVVPAEGAALTAEAMREFLATRLPDWMIPAAFVRLASLPLTGNGKLDHTALPEPSPDNRLDDVQYRAPETPTEQRTAAIVAGVLSLERVGADDNFFLIGGHSLLGTQVVLRTRDAFDVDVTLWHLFEAQTVGRLAAKIEQLLVEKVATMSEEEAQRLLAS
jgi:amino acid adenylation domain-containing protein